MPAAETAGPVWHFTTLGDPPDLIISDVAWNPGTDLQAGQSITFTATVENTGSGPVVDAFKVEFYVNGQSIGYQTVNPVMPAGRVFTGQPQLDGCDRGPHALKSGRTVSKKWSRPSKRTTICP